MITFTRITVDPAVSNGKPCIRGMRFPVSRLLGLLAAGETREAILQAYPYLEPEDISEVLRYAAYLAEEETVELGGGEGQGEGVGKPDKASFPLILTFSPRGRRDSGNC